MKYSFLIIGFVVANLLIAQENPKIGTAFVKTLDGKNFNTDSIKNGGKPILISFWATWCKPCVAELNAIFENYVDWQKETGIKVVAISVDDSRTTNSVPNFVNGRSWTYEVYCDPNGEFKRAMNVNNVPHSFLINGKREIVSQHTSFSPGDEDKLYEEIKKLVAASK